MKGYDNIIEPIDDTPEAVAKTMFNLRPNASLQLPKANLYFGDCREVLADMDDNSIHMALTDPPYFLDGLDNDWSKGGDTQIGTGTVGGLPVGMQFKADQGRKLQEFMEPVAAELLRILKPGSYALVFSSPRLAHRMAVAFEDQGFEIRDQYAWHFTKKAQFKAFSMDHFVAKRDDLSKAEKKEYIRNMAGRKTPQLRPQFESIICAQKPREGTFVKNWIEHETGLIDAGQALRGKVPSTVMTVEKDVKAKFNGHLTPKPIRICEHLIRLFSKEGQTVIDPFLGSGTTCVAAYKANRHSIGIDVNPNYVQIAKQRIEDVHNDYTAT